MPSKDLPNRKRVPLRTRVTPERSNPGEIESFPWIGLVRDSVSLSLSPNHKRLSVQHGLVITANFLTISWATAAPGELSATSNHLHRVRQNPDEVCLWAVSHFKCVWR